MYTNKYKTLTNYQSIFSMCKDNDIDLQNVLLIYCFQG